MSNKDPKYISGEYISVITGKFVDRVPVIDKNGNRFSISKYDPRYISGEVVPLSKGRKHSEETKEKFRNSITQQGIKNSQYETIWIYNIELQQNKKIKKFENIPKGWLKGRKQKYWY